MGITANGPIDYRLTIENVVTVGESYRQAGYRAIQVWVRMRPAASLDWYGFCIQLEDKQGNRWAVRNSFQATSDGHQVFFFDIPDSVSDQGNLNVLLLENQDLIATVAAHF